MILAVICKAKDAIDGDTEVDKEVLSIAVP